MVLHLHCKTKTKVFRLPVVESKLQFLNQALLQSGNLYLSTINRLVLVGETNRTLAYNYLVETDFLQFDEIVGFEINTIADSHPDFSSSGSPINVGFLSFRSDCTPFGTDETHIVAYDNFLAVASQVIFGDVNGDGIVDLLDVQPFVNLLTTATFQPEADVNCDGSVNLLDVAPFVDALSN